MYVIIYSKICVIIFFLYDSLRLDVLFFKVIVVLFVVEVLLFIFIKYFRS